MVQDRLSKEEASNILDQKVHMVATIHPHKIEVNRVCVTIDGDVLDYPGATTTNCTSLTTTK